MSVSIFYGKFLELKVFRLLGKYYLDLNVPFPWFRKIQFFQRKLSFSVCEIKCLKPCIRQKEEKLRNMVT